MKWGVLSLTVLLLGAALAYTLQRDPGYVFLSYGNWSVEMSLALAGLLIALSFIAIYIVVSSVNAVVSIPGRIRKWMHGKREHKANEALRQGLIAHTEGKWEHAEKALVAQAKKSPNPMIHYLAAARAAHAQGSHDRAQKYLEYAKQHASRDDHTVHILQAEFAIERREYSDAVATLADLHKRTPKNPQITALLAKTYQELHQWNDVMALLPDIKKYKVMNTEKIHHMEVQAASGLLRSTHITNLDELVKQWDDLAKDTRRNTSVIATYCEQLIKYSGSDQAEPILRDTLNNHWEKRLIQIYGSLETSNVSKQLETAEKWLKTHDQDATLLFSLGRICLRNKLWGKARDYLEMSLRVEKNAEAYHTLALLLEQMNEPEKAAECYRKGLEVSAHQVFEYFPRKASGGSRLLFQQ